MFFDPISAPSSLDRSWMGRSTEMPCAATRNVASRESQPPMRTTARPVTVPAM